MLGEAGPPVLELDTPPNSPLPQVALPLDVPRGPQQRNLGRGLERCAAVGLVALVVLVRLDLHGRRRLDGEDDGAPRPGGLLRRTRLELNSLVSAQPGLSDAGRGRRGLEADPRLGKEVGTGVGAG